MHLSSAEKARPLTEKWSSTPRAIITSARIYARRDPRQLRGNGVALAADGCLYVADSDNRRLRKIARGGKGIDIQLSVQHILNCGNVGSCHGGSVTGPYQGLKKLSAETGQGISYETSNPYMACSSESKEGICGAVDWTCTPMNVARTCSTFPPRGKCLPIAKYPNITISDYGSVEGAEDMEVWTPQEIM